MNEKTTSRLQFIVTVVYFAVIAGLVYLALKYVVRWVLPFLIAFLIVSIIHPIIRKIKKVLRIEREIISLIVMAMVYIVVCTAIAAVITQLVFMVRDLVTGLPDYYTNSLGPALQDLGESLSGFLQNLPQDWQAAFLGAQDDIISTIQNALLSVPQKAAPRLTVRVPSFFLSLLFTIMLSFFISTQYSSVIAFIRRMLPNSVNRLVTDVKGVIVQTVGRYLRALLTMMIITAVELSIGLSVIGADHAIPIAIGIAIFDVLPIFGTGTILIPWCIVELIRGNYPFAFGLAIIYGIVVVVRNILEPKIVSDRLGLNPIVSLSAIYLGFRTLGVFGMILMPILVQIIVALHQNGSITFFHDLVTVGEPEQNDPPKDEQQKND